MSLYVCNTYVILTHTYCTVLVRSPGMAAAVLLHLVFTGTPSSTIRLDAGACAALGFVSSSLMCSSCDSLGALLSPPLLSPKPKVYIICHAVPNPCGSLKFFILCHRSRTTANFCSTYTCMYTHTYLRALYHHVLTIKQRRPWPRR